MWYTRIVATNVGGIPEVIENGKNGFLVPPRNKELLMDRLIILINDVSLREKFAKKSVEIIRNELNIDKKINELIKLYDYELNFKP